MRLYFTLLSIGIVTLAIAARGETYHTLSGFQDELKIPAGQTAFVISASENVVVSLEKNGKSPLQFQFAGAQKHGCNPCRISNTAHSQRTTLPSPSAEKPVPIAGPVKLVLRTTGIVTVTIPEERQRSSFSFSNGPRRYASR